MLGLVSYSLNIGDAALRGTIPRNNLGLQATGQSLVKDTNLPAKFLYAKLGEGVLAGDLLWFDPITGIAKKGIGKGISAVAILGGSVNWYMWLLVEGLVEVENEGNAGDLVYSDGIKLQAQTADYFLINSFYLQKNIIYLGD